MNITRPTYLEIDLSKLKHNIKTIQKKVGKKVKLMPVIKANGYGTHLNYCPDILNRFEYVGVALLDEAIELH